MARETQTLWLRARTVAAIISSYFLSCATWASIPPSKPLPFHPDTLTPRLQPNRQAAVFSRLLGAPAQLLDIRHSLTSPPNLLSAADFEGLKKYPAEKLPAFVVNAADQQERKEWVEKALSPHGTRKGEGLMCTMALNRQALGLVPEILHFLEYAQQHPPTQMQDSPLFTFSTEPPAGFEALNEPQTTLLTVYYQGRLVGSAEATFTPTEVQLTNPLQLIERIEGVKDKTKVAAALSGQLAPHADLVCINKRPIPVCGLPPLEEAAVVFNRSNYRLDVFIAPQYLTPTARTSDLLPPPTAGWSLSDGMNLIIAGSTRGGDPNYNFIQQGALADGSKRLNYQASYAHSNNSGGSNSTGSGQGQWSMQQLNGEWDYKQYVTQAGYIETIGDTFVGNQNILGASFGTSLKTLRPDVRNAYGSSLVVFLSLPSQVSIYRDNRLLLSGFYQAGEQLIDTTALPAGSYPITLKIQDNLGNIKEETRFYVKSMLIPPKGYPIYYVNMGYLTNANSFSQTGGGATFLPQATSLLIYQVGLNRRIGDSWGVNANAVGSMHNSYLSSGLFFLLPYYQLQLQPQVIAGSNKDYGVAVTASAYVGRFNLNFDARKLWAKNSTSLDVVDPAVFDPLTQNQSQLGFNVGYSVGKTTLTLNSQWNQSGTQPTTYSYGISSRSKLHRFKKGYLELDLSASRSSSDSLLTVASLVWYMNDNNFSNRVSAGYQRDQSVPANTGVLASASTTWTHYDAAQQGLVLGANVNHAANQQTVGGNIDDLNRYVRVTGQAQYTQQTGSDNSSAVTQYTGNIGSRLIWAKDAPLTMGGARGQDAGVIVNIDSDLPGQEFQVLDNRQVAGVVKTNSPTPVFLNAYRNYPLAIKAVSKGFFTYDESPKEIVLYPGNYQYLNWKAQQKLIIFTQVLLSNHQPLASARVEGSADFNYTDEQGYVQLEVFNNTHELEFQQSAEQRCKVQLPQNLKFENNYTSLDSVICVPLPGSEPMNSAKIDQPAVPAVSEAAVEQKKEQKPLPVPPAPSSTFVIPWYREEKQPPRYFDLDGSAEKDPFSLLSLEAEPPPE